MRPGSKGRSSPTTAALIRCALSRSRPPGPAPSFDYLSGTVLSAEISVNGGSPLTVQFGITGSYGESEVLGTHVLQVPLKAGANTILVSNPTGLAPDFDAIDVFE